MVAIYTLLFFFVYRVNSVVITSLAGCCNTNYPTGLTMGEEGREIIKDAYILL